MRSFLFSGTLCAPGRHEGSLSEGIRHAGLRGVCSPGQSKTQLQETAIAVAINLVRIRQMLPRTQQGHSPWPIRPLSPFARLRTR